MEINQVNEADGAAKRLSICRFLPFKQQFIQMIYDESFRITWLKGFVHNIDSILLSFDDSNREKGVVIQMKSYFLQPRNCNNLMSLIKCIFF